MRLDSRRFRLLGLTFTATALACGDDASSTTSPFDDESTSEVTNQTLSESTLTQGDETTTDVADETTEGTTSADETTTGGEATCSDGVRNQDETDVDCGGDVCDGCATGLQCIDDGDCLSMNCDGASCRDPACDDVVMNGDETDVDCGGSCDPCADNLGCVDDTDCVSAMCVEDHCFPAACNDGVQNGSETDLDCGGAACPGCPEGDMCEENEDCATLFCDNGSCLAVECVDNGDCSDLAGQCVIGVCNDTTHECEAQSAFEGADCAEGDNCITSTCVAGLCGNPVPVNCSFLDDGCAVGVCNPANGSCFGSALNDGDPCDDGMLCTSNSTCSGGDCTNGEPTDCSFLDNGCQAGSCNQFTGQCQVTLVADGTPCDDGFACSTNEECLAGACVPDNLTSFWSEDFADNSAGWTLGTEWAIGSAMESMCTTLSFMQDPGMDHTATADNGVAGVVIGGCAQQVVHDFYCLTSPVVDTSDANGPMLLDFWRSLHSDYTPFMQNRIDAFDGAQWQTIWQSGSSPGINDAGWVEIQNDLSSFKHDAFQVRFCFNIASGGVYNIGSWNVDDVELRACP